MIMIKTVKVYLENVDNVTILMNHLDFFETDRNVLNDPDNEIVVVLTFVGEEDCYREDAFIKTPKKINTEEGYFLYHSLLVPDGLQTNDFKRFKKLHENRKAKPVTVEHFN